MLELISQNGCLELEKLSSPSPVKNPSPKSKDQRKGNRTAEADQDH